MDHVIAKPRAIALKAPVKTSTLASGAAALKTTRMKNSPVSVSSNCWASRILKPPSNSAAETFATIPGRLTQERVRMWRVLDTRAPYGSGRRRRLPLRLFQQGLDRGQDFFNDDCDAIRVGVQPVRLVELWIARDAVKEE